MIVEARAVAHVSLQAAATRMRRLLVERSLERLVVSATDDGDADGATGGDSVVMRAGLPGISKQVAVQALEPIYRPGRVVIPMRWVATGRAGELFPALDGNLELIERADDGTDLHLVGSYQPPLGRTGEMLDQLVMHRVARRTLDSFLGRLADAVTDPAAGAVADGQSGRALRSPLEPRTDP